MKTKTARTITMLILAFSTLGLFAQEKETRTIGDFSKIDVSSGVNLYITQGNNIDLVVESDKSDMHKIITEVDGTTLRIYNKKSYNWGMNKAPKVYLTFKELEAISCNGGADVYGQNLIVSEKIKISTSGGADAYLEIQSSDVILSTSGGSDIKIKGTTVNLEASASGGSDINANELKAENVTVKASGGGDAKVWATKQLTAKASGGGDIDYYGSPEIKNITESGGGDISKK